MATTRITARVLAVLGLLHVLYTSASTTYSHTKATEMPRAYWYMAGFGGICMLADVVKILRLLVVNREPPLRAFKSVYMAHAYLVWSWPLLKEAFPFGRVIFVMLAVMASEAALRKYEEPAREPEVEPLGPPDEKKNS